MGTRNILCRAWEKKQTTLHHDSDKIMRSMCYPRAYIDTTQIITKNVFCFMSFKIIGTNLFFLNSSNLCLETLHLMGAILFPFCTILSHLHGWGDEHLILRREGEWNTYSDLEMKMLKIFNTKYVLYCTENE